MAEQKTQQSPKAKPAEAPKAASKDEAAELAEAQQAATVASTASPPPPPEPTKEEKKESEKAGKAARDVADKLTALSFEELTRLRTALDSAFFNKGSEPDAPAGPSLDETVAQLPVNHDATEELDFSKVCKSVDCEESEVVGYAVRQARNAAGRHSGPQYVRVVKADGSKQTAKV
jgi:hypothetical protein